MPYIPGLPPADPGPLARFLPPLEKGTVSTWLSAHVAAGAWILDPFGFSPLLPLEAARAGYRTLVTVNNPITRFLIELELDPPSEADFKAALADLAASKRGDERLENHLQSLYLTRCQQCGREIEASAFLWRKGADAPFARIYECSECGDRGERGVTEEDVQRARGLANTDILHRSRALERVATKDDPERLHVQEAIQHYLPRPLYFLTTVVNRIDSLDLSPQRRRALTAVALVACDAGNTMWGHREHRPRPKQLLTPEEFEEQNLWKVLEQARRLWEGARVEVPYSAWPNRIPEAGGVCIYEGRLRNLAAEVRKEIPIAAALGSVPRPNQAFWTLSALWAGWLWGRAAMEPYRMALRRRRYDWAWNATALHAAFLHLSDLLALGTPFFGLVPEVESQFLLSVLTAISAAGFDLQGFALRSEDDPVQFLWNRGERLHRDTQPPSEKDLQLAMFEFLAERGEPASYLHMKSSALQLLAQSHGLRSEGQDLEMALRENRTAIESAIRHDQRFVHHSAGESVEAGTWGLRDWPTAETLTDSAEVTIVSYLQKHPECERLEVETDVCEAFPGLYTPSRRTVQAILQSYAELKSSRWVLRDEDKALNRQNDVREIERLVGLIGERLGYQTRRQGKWLAWEQRAEPAVALTILASSILTPVLMQNPYPPEISILVVPGGRVGLLAYKSSIQPTLAARLGGYRITRFRFWRALADVKLLSREAFEQRLSADPVDRTQGQLMMF